MPDEDETDDTDDDDETELYSCDECGNWYLTRQSLQAHSHVHKGEDGGDG